MLSPLEIFDFFQTVFILALLVVTIPLACFVYSKLLFVQPFSENYTFKLIVLNGTTHLLTCVSFLILYQFTSFSFMNDFYLSIQEIGLASPLTVVYLVLNSTSLNTSLFIALNRLKSIMFIRKKSNDSQFFWISICTSIFLSQPTIFDFCFFTTMRYEPYTYGNASGLLPITEISNHTLETVSFSICVVISLATLVVNIYLYILITRKRYFIDATERKRFNGEKGLVITSIVSYIFYMLYFSNMLIVRNFDVLFCGFAQFLFIGLHSITPLWCLLLFAPSVRRVVFRRRRNTKATTIQRQSASALNSPLRLRHSESVFHTSSM